MIKRKALKIIAHRSLRPLPSLMEMAVRAQPLSRVWLFAPHGLCPARLLRPWNFPGKNTGVGCPFLLLRIFPEIEPISLVSPSLADRFFTTMPPGKPQWGWLFLPYWTKIQASDSKLCLSKDNMALMPRWCWQVFNEKSHLAKITFVFLSATESKRTGRTYYGTGTYKWRS